MKKLPEARIIIVPIAALVVGLLIGLGVGQMQVKKEQKLSKDMIKEKDKKIAFIQRKMAEDKAEATGSIEQKCRDDVSRLQAVLQAAVQSEKKKTGALSGQVGTLTEQAQKLEARLKTAEDTAAKTKQELHEALRDNKELDRELKKTAGEKQALQADLKKTSRELGSCSSHNAELALIAEELVKRYKDKGIGAALLEKEPLTQVRKVELEQLTSQYCEEIEQKKIKK